MDYYKHFITYSICVAEDLTLKEKVAALENLDFLAEAKASKPLLKATAGDGYAAKLMKKKRNASKVPKMLQGHKPTPGKIRGVGGRVGGKAKSIQPSVGKKMAAFLKAKAGTAAKTAKVVAKAL